MKCGPLDNTVYRKCPMALKADFVLTVILHSANNHKPTKGMLTFWCLLYENE